MSARDDVMKVVREAQTVLMTNRSGWTTATLFIKAREMLTWGMDDSEPEETRQARLIQAVALMLTALERMALNSRPTS